MSLLSGSCMLCGARLPGADGECGPAWSLYACAECASTATHDELKAARTEAIGNALIAVMGEGQDFFRSLELLRAGIEAADVPPEHVDEVLLNLGCLPEEERVSVARIYAAYAEFLEAQP